MALATQKNAPRQRRAIADVTVHPVEEAAVLFDRRRQALFTANPSATTIWRGLAAGFAPEAIAELLASNAEHAQSAARRHVAETLRQWRRARRQASPLAAGVAAVTRAERSEDGAVPDRPVRRLHYRVLDTLVTLHIAAGVPLADAEAVLHHLQGEDREAAVPREVEIRPAPGGFLAVEKGRVLYRCAKASEIPALIKAALTDCALDDGDVLAAVHAAALYRRGCCLLLPGASGNGKSCLAAALARRGFTLLGDDTVVLDRQHMTLRPLPYGICIKEPAPAPLAAQFPELSQAPLCARPDGKAVRYLTPPAIETAAAGESATPTQIVFPSYHPQGETALYALSPESVLKRLVPCFVPLRAEMAPEDIDRLIAWVSGLQCFALRISSLAEAANLLERLGE